MKLSTILLAAAGIAFGHGAAAQQMIAPSPPHQAEPAQRQEAQPPQPPLFAEQPAAIVEMNDALEFNPPTITVRVGDTVEWRTVGRHAHTITTDPDRADNPGLIALPQGAEPFHSGPISTRDIFRYTFTIPGQYTYFCVPHEGEGMIGTVIVEE